MRIDLDPQKLAPAEKKNPRKKTPQKLTPFSQIKKLCSTGTEYIGLKQEHYDDFPLEKATRHGA